ncbi:MAG: DUF1854 domain-containing protein [Lentisphaeria bacterium]|nr:DUF1854 domain-containing protein [Lentisphaeria bacterium]
MNDDTTQSEASGLRLDWGVAADKMRVWEDEFRILHLEVDGKTFDDISPRKIFPLSSKAPYISFMADKEGEVALLLNPEDLDSESHAALDFALERTYYRLIITRVDSIGEIMGVSMWEVQTNQGYAKFEVVDRQRHIRPLPGGRLIITDADGNRFEIPSVQDLDETSRRLIESET